MGYGYNRNGYNPDGFGYRGYNDRQLKEDQWVRRSTYGREYHRYVPFQGNGGSNRPKRKRSGCKQGTGKTGLHYISGWNKSRGRGFITLIASQRKGGKDRMGNDRPNVCVNQKGEELLIYVCSVRFPHGVETYTGFYNPNDGKLRIPDLNMTANPRAANGGYFGKSSVSRKNG